MILSRIQNTKYRKPVCCSKTVLRKTYDHGYDKDALTTTFWPFFMSMAFVNLVVAKFDKLSKALTPY